MAKTAPVWTRHLLVLSGLTGAALVGCAGRGSDKGPLVSSGAAAASRGLSNATWQACVPTGPERCFDARDDNCNGVIDEGCGVRTGIVDFQIAWSAPTADVDLLVTDPRGELVEVGRPSAAGLVKERDCPGRKQECKGVNLENVYLDRSEAKRGRYKVRIRLERLDGEDAPIHVTFGARVGPKVYSAEIDLTRPEDQKDLVFEL